MKGLAAFRTKAKYDKMSIEGRDLVSTQSSHYSEARAIHDGKILVAPGNADVPSNFQIARVTVSIAAIPLRRPSQNRSAALRSSWW